MFLRWADYNKLQKASHLSEFRHEILSGIVKELVGVVCADRYGRGKIIPIGFLVAACSVFLLVPLWSVWIVAIAVTVLSVGFDMTHPMMAGIVTNLDPTRRGQAMGLNAFVLFTGFGIGSYIFQLLLKSGFSTALISFAVVQTFLGLLSLRLFKNEKPTV